MSRVPGPLPPLVLAAHGSPHPAHRLAVLALRDAVASGGGDVRVGWIESEEPTLGVAAAAAGRTPDGRRSAGMGGASAVVVPLLLTAGHHARVDLPRLLADAPRAVPSAVLGPDPLLAAALGRRLAEAGTGPHAAVVLGAAGSSDPSARRQVDQLARLLADARDTPVVAAYASGPRPRVADAVRALASAGRPVVVATCLLCPGALADRVVAAATAAAAPATAPLGTAPEVVALVRERWREAAAAAHGASATPRVA